MIDTIDTLAGLSTAVGDLFAWIDYCYDLRDTYLSYHHLSFAVFGQADISTLDLLQMSHVVMSSEDLGHDKGDRSFFRMTTTSLSALACDQGKRASAMVSTGVGRSLSISQSGSPTRLLSTYIAPPGLSYSA